MLQNARNYVARPKGTKHAHITTQRIPFSLVSIRVYNLVSPNLFWASERSPVCDACSRCRYVCIENVTPALLLRTRQFSYGHGRMLVFVLFGFDTIILLDFGVIIRCVATHVCIYYVVSRIHPNGLKRMICEEVDLKHRVFLGCA